MSAENAAAVQNEPYAIEMLHITKRFPGIIANDDISLQLRKGEIHSLLGENGAGKSTLMSVLFGLYQPSFSGSNPTKPDSCRKPKPEKKSLLCPRNMV